MNCEAQVWDRFRHVACGNRAKVEVDGKHYCGVHDPIKQQAKQAKRDAIYEARSAVRHASWAITDHRNKLVKWALDNLPETHPLMIAWRELHVEQERVRAEQASLE